VYTQRVVRFARIAAWHCSSRVAGHDVVREAAVVQRNIRVTAQDATVDEVLTGRQNLVMIGRLSGLRRRQARARAASRASLRRVMWVRSGVGKGR
jgi:ABC-type multidrug transport system ATPase subunit